MSESIFNQISENGYVFLKKHKIDSSTLDVANDIGITITPSLGRLVQELIPKASSTPNTYSGNFGLDFFPFHTDLAHWRVPPRYLILRCIKGYEEVKTLLLDGKTLIDTITSDILGRSIYEPRRPRAGSKILIRIYEEIDEGHRFRWDELFIKPASKIAIIADKQIKKYLKETPPITKSLSEYGDMLIIDNWRMLHSRSQVQDEQQDRKIERIYLEKLH